MYLVLIPLLICARSVTFVSVKALVFIELASKEPAGQGTQTLKMKHLSNLLNRHASHNETPAKSY